MIVCVYAPLLVFMRHVAWNAAERQRSRVGGEALGERRSTFTRQIVQRSAAGPQRASSARR